MSEKGLEVDDSAICLSTILKMTLDQRAYVAGSGAALASRAYSDQFGTYKIELALRLAEGHAEFDTLNSAALEDGKVILKNAIASEGKWSIDVHFGRHVRSIGTDSNATFLQPASYNELAGFVLSLDDHDLFDALMDLKSELRQANRERKPACRATLSLPKW